MIRDIQRFSDTLTHNQTFSFLIPIVFHFQSSLESMCILIKVYLLTYILHILTLKSDSIRCQYV